MRRWLRTGLMSAVSHFSTPTVTRVACRSSGQLRAAAPAAQVAVGTHFLNGYSQLQPPSLRALAPPRALSFSSIASARSASEGEPQDNGMPSTSNHSNFGHCTRPFPLANELVAGEQAAALAAAGVPGHQIPTAVLIVSDELAAHRFGEAYASGLRAQSWRRFARGSLL